MIALLLSKRDSTCFRFKVDFDGIMYILQASGFMDVAVSNTDNLVHDCSNSSALPMELLQSCTKPLPIIEQNSRVLFEVIVTRSLSNQYVRPKTNNLYTVWISLNCGLGEVFLIQCGPNIIHISRKADRHGWWHKRIESSTLARVLLFMKQYIALWSRVLSNLTISLSCAPIG